MKKYIAFLLCLIMIFSLFSCQPNEASDELSSNDNIPPSLSEVELAMQAYQAAIDGEICVVDGHLGEIKLKDCRFASDNRKLGECEILSKAILDMDGDGINEYVIQSEAKDHIVLRYDQGKVYSYCFDSSCLYNLNSDGSFYWIDDEARGLCRLAFDGSSFSLREIYQISPPYDDEYQFYMDGKQITYDEFFEYYRSNHKNEATFTPLDFSCAYSISSERACELASIYWDITDGMSEGAAGTRIVYRIVITEKPTGDTPYYRVCWQTEAYHNNVPDGWHGLPPRDVRTHRELFVDAVTGECRDANTPSAFDSN